MSSSSFDATQSAAASQFDKQSDQYGKTHILADTRDLDASVDGMDFPRSGRALDIATVGGHTALWLASRGLDVTACDVSVRMLENASELSAAAGKQIVTRQHAAEALPYDDESFDAVTCRVAAHHFSSPAAFVSESFRVLKRGGYFLLIDGTVPDDEPADALWMNTVEKLRDSSHARLLSPGEWQQLCIDAGLFLQRIEITRMHQPDLTWYFKTAATRYENRQKVIELYESASPHLRSIFNICTVDGPRTWKWHRLQLLARR